MIALAAQGIQTNSRDEQSVARTTSTDLAEARSSKSAISVVDDVVETNVVARLAETANLAVAPNTASLSVSMAVLQDSPQTVGELEKPKILEVESANREIMSYSTIQEETIQSIADKYGITAQTVKWVNNLKGDKVESGKDLRILPVDGLVYKIKAGDKLEDLAKKYEANAERIVSYNDIEGDNLAEGREIVIPGGILPEKERPDYVAPRVVRRAAVNNQYSAPTAVLSPNYNVKAGNAYAPGNCTWYVYNKRPDIGSFWGNAASWAVSARAAGYRVDSTPAVGAIAQWNAWAGGSWGWGHVGVVESVNGDGTVTISEMNYAGALYRVTSRTVPISSVSNYIH